MKEKKGKNEGKKSYFVFKIRKEGKKRGRSKTSKK
jgi:hypothetical protein